MNTDSPTFTIKHFRWADEFGGPKKNGIRIDRARGWIFIPDSEVLGLAEALADHIQYSKSKETQR